MFFLVAGLLLVVYKILLDGKVAAETRDVELLEQVAHLQVDKENIFLGVA